MKKTRPYILLLITVTVGCVFGEPARAQNISINATAVEKLIQEWNFAHNTRNDESFRKVYSDHLLFYTQELSQEKAIQLKQKMFRLKPEFRQRVKVPVTYTPYTTGLIKCEFVKEVFEKTAWKKYNAYLLVTYQDRRYLIVGESDDSTDRVLKYALDLGEPMIFGRAAQDDEGQAAGDSGPAAAAPRRVADSSTVANSKDISGVFSDLSSMGMVAIPKKYLFILIGLLAGGGILIFVADKANPPAPARERGASLVRHTEAEQVVKDFKMQSVFESFVITLFDPLYFRHKRPKSEPVLAGKVPGVETVPDLLFEYSYKDTRVPFAIKCQYYKHIAKNEVQLFPSERLHLFREFEEEGDMALYYVLGFGGTPDDPKELFFVPARAVKNEYISKAALRQFSKSGMFYYNRSAGKIQ